MSFERIGYHKRYGLSAKNELVEVDAGEAPVKGAIKAELLDLRCKHAALNDRLVSAKAQQEILESSPAQAGVYPLKVTSFTCSCEGNDEDGAARQLAERLGNLRIITHVPFMRKGNIVFAIRSQGLVSPAGDVESVDALFNGWIYWRGKLTEHRFDYELLMFKWDKDIFVGRMSESIDLGTKVADIDPALYQAEVGYHLDQESNDSFGVATLPRPLETYGSPAELAQITSCYQASAAFGAAVAHDQTDLAKLARDARNACVAVPGKRYYQAYDAWLQGIAYDPLTSG